MEQPESRQSKSLAASIKKRDIGMDIRTAVKDKENYGEIVNWFRSQGALDIDQMVLLVDTIEAMSEEIFEHYRALQDICRREVKRIQNRYREKAATDAGLNESDRRRLAYVIEKACRLGVLLSEKYEDMARDLVKEQQ